MLNQTIGSYKITNFLGWTAGLEQFRAVRLESPDQRVGVKRVPRNGHPTSVEERDLRRIDRRVRGFRHPCHLGHRELLVADDALFLVTDHLNGHPLSALIPTGGIRPIPHAMGLFQQAAETVAAAHDEGLLHGALSADCVLFSPDKRLRVDGFGFLNLLGRMELTRTPAEPGYLAPELREGGEPSVATDIFALGALLVHLLIGEPPKPPEAAEGRAPAQQARRLRPDLPPRLTALIDRATAQEPEQRFDSVREILDLAADVGPTGHEGRLVRIGGHRDASPRSQPLASSPDSTGLPELSDLPEMVTMPGGGFLMGNDRRPNEAPAHRVEVEEMEVGRYPVTNRQYRRFCEETGHGVPDDPPGWEGYFLDFPDHPVVHVSCRDAEAYCRWLSEQLDAEVRLPTEEEWEKAARGGVEGALYPWGDEPPDERAHFGFRVHAWDWEARGPRTRRVGTYRANGYGLHDMAGNVWEWTADWYAPYADRSEKPKGGVFRVVRGGAWNSEADALRCAYRLSIYHTTRDYFTGFRCVAGAR